MTNDQIEQLNNCIPTLRSEYVAACYMLAEAVNAEDAGKWREWLLAASQEIVGGLPPMTDAALRIIAGSNTGDANDSEETSQAEGGAQIDAQAQGTGT